MIVTNWCEGCDWSCDGAAKAERIIDILEKAELITAPSLYIYEASNVMSRLTRWGLAFKIILGKR